MMSSTVIAALNKLIEKHGRKKVEIALKALQPGPDFKFQRFKYRSFLEQDIIRELRACRAVKMLNTICGEWVDTAVFGAPDPARIYHIKSFVTMPPLPPKVKRFDYYLRWCNHPPRLHCFRQCGPCSSACCYWSCEGYKLRETSNHEETSHPCT